MTNWNDILAVYAVLVASDPENPTEVASLDKYKIEKLKAIFWDMNIIRYSLDEVEIVTDKDTVEPITKNTLTITISPMTVEDMISYYGLDVNHTAQVRELLQPKYNEWFQQLTGAE